MSTRKPHLPDTLPAEFEGKPLTQREQQVLRLRARGLDNAAVARELGISPDTVKKHMTVVMLKMGLHRAAPVIYVVYGCERTDCAGRLQRPGETHESP